MGMLLGAHSAYVEVPELQFHTDKAGLMDLMAGAIGLERFLENLEDWYHRSPPPERPCGLHELVPRQRFDAIRADFAAAFPRDAESAGRRLIRSLVEPRVAAAGKPSWVEATPTTTGAATRLHALVPEARFIHMLRDGRESVVSAARKGWTSEDPDEGMRAWENQMRRVDAGCRALPPGRFLAIELVDLVRDRRDETYERLLDFTAIEDEPALRRFFDTRVSVGSTRIEDWREDLEPAELEALDEAYAAALERLRRDGVSLLPRTEVVG